MRLTASVLLFLATLGLQAQPMVDLYLEPEDNAVVFQRAPLAKMESLSPEHPVIDGEVDEEWLRVKYPGQYIGFVEVDDYNDDGSFDTGTKLYMQRDTDSEVITIIQMGDWAQVIDQSGDWLTISYRGDGRVYYKNPLKHPPSNAPAPAPMVTQARGEPAVVTPLPPVTAPTPPPDSVTASVPVVSTPQDGGEIFAFETSPAAAGAANVPTQEVAPAPAPPPSSGRPLAPPPGVAPRTGPLATADNQEILRRDVRRTYKGTFERVSGFDFNWFGPDYKYALDDASGKRIAYVDVSETLIFSPLENYFGKDIIIEGTAEKISGTVPIVIKASFMRFK